MTASLSGAVEATLLGATVVLPSGQARLVLPSVPRRLYPTGQQELCSACAAAGVDRQGVSRDGPGSAPLCLPCWRGRQQRRAREDDEALLSLAGEFDLPAVAVRRLDAELALAVEVFEAASCPVCGPDRDDAVPVHELLPPGAAATRRRQRRRRRRWHERRARRRAQSAPAGSGCWLCGNAWLRRVREQFEQDQADAAAIAAAEVEAEFARIAAAADAEARVSELRAWIERLTGTVEAYRRRRGRGRAVELLADVLARAAVVRTSGRGRPSALGVVAAVMAVDADFKSGRRARPGRERTAWLAGVSSRAVYSSWGQGQALGAWVRTCRGGRNNQARRIETGRFNDRAEFDFAPLHRGDSVARAGYVPAALGVLDGLLTHAEGLLRQAQAELDALAGSDFTALARRAAMRRAVARAHDTVTATLAALDTANSCHTHTVSKGECVSSWLYWGYSYSPEHMINSNDRQGRPPSDREEDGASRSPTRATQGDLEGSRSTRGRCSSPRRVERPRTLQTACGRPRRGRGPRPEWAQWAPVLARDLRELWPWLDRERSAAVAAVLGAALGPDWTAEELARHAGQCGWVLLDEPPRSPLGYLKTLLTAVLTGDQQPPHPARRAIEHRRAQVVAERAERAADRWCGRCDRHRRVEVNHHDRTVPCPRCSPAAAGSTAWPEVRQPGSGLPRTPDDARRGS